MRKLIVLLLIALTFASGRAQAPADTTVWLVTCYPGTQIYELEGHTALRISFASGADYAVHWGLFDFEAPNFLYRFVKGETDYMCGAVPWPWFVEAYRRTGRRVEQQRLDLTPEQTARLVETVQENLLPENRVYRYNYVKDNCSTRPLAIIERAVEPDSIVLAQTGLPVENPTFRRVMRYYHANYPWYQFGIDLALGSGIDYELDNHELAFAPVLLIEQLAGATAGGCPLVGQTDVVIDLPADNAVLGPTPWLLRPTTVCWAVFLLLLAVTVRDLRRRRVTRWVDAVYFGILGLAGLLLTFLIFVSVHEATSPNWLYAWLNPFCLIPTIFIWLKKCKKVVICYQFINFAVVLLLLIAWPWVPQSANPAFLPLVLADLMRSLSYLYISKSDN